MKQIEKNKIFKEITDEMLKLYADKNEMYGDSFNKLMHKHGLIAGIVPLENKLQRIESLVKLGKHKFESLEDTLTDLACYSILFLIHLKEKESEQTQGVSCKEQPNIVYYDELSTPSHEDLSKLTGVMPHPNIPGSGDAVYCSGLEGRGRSVHDDVWDTNAIFIVRGVESPSNDGYICKFTPGSSEEKIHPCGTLKVVYDRDTKEIVAVHYNDKLQKELSMDCVLTVNENGNKRFYDRNGGVTLTVEQMTNFVEVMKGC